MVAILRFIGPRGKSFITRAYTWRTEPHQVSCVIWDNAVRKHGHNKFRREILWKDDRVQIDSPVVTRMFNKFVKKYEPEYNM
ncbi:hypothetical protein N9095_00065 [bacterium]|nr:hypothetical protein [bacterium]